MNIKLKNILSYIGKLLGVFGLIFVVHKLSQEYTIDTFLIKLQAFKYSLFYLVVLNYISLLLGITAWYLMLLNYAKKPFGFITSYYYFAKTEIAKYLPGNIFHFVGRQILANKLTITQKEMMKISLLFSFLLLGATIISSTLFTLFSSEIPAYIKYLMILVTIITLVSSYYLYPSFSLNKKVYMNIILAISVSLQGIILGLIVLQQIPTLTINSFFQLVSIYIISWLIGFVTPGASGGLGVREGAFIAIVLFLHLDISNEIIVFSVLLVRFINILVDILAFLSTYILKNKVQKYIL